MDQPINTIIFGGIALLIISYLASLQAMFSAAKKNDPLFFEEIGSPHIILNNKLKHTTKILKALLTFRYRESRDKKVRFWGDVAYFMFVAIVIGFGCFFYAP